MTSLTQDGKISFDFHMHAQVATECLLWLANQLPGIDEIYVFIAVARCAEDIA